MSWGPRRAGTRPRQPGCRGAGRRTLRPAGVAARARGCFPCSGKVSGSPEKLQPELEEEEEEGEGEGKGGWRKVGKRREGEGEEEEGKNPAPARVFHVYKLTPPPPSLPPCPQPLPIPRAPSARVPTPFSHSGNQGPSASSGFVPRPGLCQPSGPGPESLD